MTLGGLEGLSESFPSPCQGSTLDDVRRANSSGSVRAIDASGALGENIDIAREVLGTGRRPSTPGRLCLPCIALLPRRAFV